MKYFFALIVILTHPSVCQEYIFFEHPTEVLEIVKNYLPEDPVIVEAGAYDGNDSQAMALFWPEAQIHSFEPIPELYVTLKENVKKFSQIQTYCLAIGDYVGIGTMFVSENIPNIPSQSSSLLEPKDHLLYSPVQFPRKIDVVVKTFDKWAQENSVDHIDFMWLDMQGYELNALKASPQMLSTVKAILTEVEFVEAYKGQYLFDDVKTWLESQGFTMIALNTSCGWFGDALFVRLEQ